MAIDIKKIDDRIQKLEMIKLLASDPEMVEILEGVVPPNGTEPQRDPPEESQDTTTPPRRGEQTQAVLRAVAQMSGQFTTADIVGVMELAGHVFAAQNPTIAVNGVLRKLVERNQLIIAVQGSGRAANRYERVTQASAQ